MSRSSPSPTSSGPINALLLQLLDGCRSILGDRLVGLYLSGSLAVGDFDPTSSDIDFVAVLTEPPTEAAADALRRLHEALGEAGTQRLEGFYVPLETLRQHDPTMPHEQVFFAGGRYLSTYRLKWDWLIECYVVREHGVVVAGPLPATLLAPISRAQLIEGVRATLRHDWSQYVDGPAWMRVRHEQAFVVLTMCRALYVLDSGAIVSKRDAAQWAQRHLPAEWSPLIERAIAWRTDATLDDAALPETVRFLHFTLNHS